MAKTGKHQEELRKIMLSCDAFTTGYSLVLLLFFVPYCVRFGGVIVLAFMPLVFLIPFAVMPIIYCAVHKFNPLLFGRYHLVMPVSAALAALFFAAAFSSGAADAGGACLIFFGMLIFAISVMTYRYCAFSVRARLIGDGVQKSSVRSVCIAVAGAVAAVATVLCFYNVDPETAYSYSAFILAAMCMITATVQYLASFYDIPRLGGKRMRSVKSAFRMLYEGIGKRRYFAALCAPAGFATAAALVVLYSNVVLPSIFVPVVVLAAAFTITTVVICNIDAPRFVYDIGRAATAVAAILLGIAEVLPRSGIYACIAVAAAVLGIGGALAWRGSRRELLYVKRRVTSGTVFLLTELTTYAAAAVALAVSAVVCGVYVYAPSAECFAYGFTAAGALSVASAILANIKRKKSGGDEGARLFCDTTIDDGLNRLLDRNEFTEEENS